MKKLIFQTSVLISILITSQIINAQTIFDAIHSGSIEKVKELVEKDSTLVNAKNARSQTPLHFAAFYNYEEIARYLIERGADINAQDYNSLTPLMFSGLATAKLIVEKGVDINFETQNGKVTALSRALTSGKKSLIDYLLDIGVSMPEPGTPNSMNYLAFALQAGSIKYLEKCLQQGIDPLVKSESNNTLLHYAATSNSTELIKKLTDLGVPLNKSNIFGWTPLHMASYYGTRSNVELLIQKGLDKNARTIDGKSPYNLANEAKRTTISNFLESLNVDLTSQKFPVLKGDYLGQKKTKDKSESFAPGIIGTQLNFHGSITFTPDGNEAYWSVVENASILGSKRVNGIWTMPALVLSDADVPFISPDGNKFFFIARKQNQGQNIEVISVMDKTPTGWSEPHALPDIINSTSGIHWQISVDRTGNLYFGARKNGSTDSRIYCAAYKDGTYQEPKIVGGLENVNAHSPYISPDGAFLIITQNEPEPELYILFKNRNGSWSIGKNISEIIGAKGICPIVSADLKYLFFLKSLDNRNIPYWINMGFIGKLQKNELKEN